MDVVFAYADRIMVLARGVLIADGTPSEIRDNPQVQQVYLGTGKTFDARGARAMSEPDARQCSGLNAWYGARTSCSTCRSRSAAARWWR